MPEQKNPQAIISKLIDTAFAGTVSKADIQALLDTFIFHFKRLTARIDDAISDIKTQAKETIADEVARLGRQVAEFEKRIRDQITAEKKATINEMERQLNLIRTDLGYVESLIKNYDDQELRAQIAQVRAEIPAIPEPTAPFDPSDILTKLKEIDELKERLRELMEKLEGIASRPVPGVTNLRIQQAFKYILKTEEPVGLINGSNTEYTVSQPIFAVLAFSLNGEVIAQLPNYTVRGNKVIFATALPSAYSGKDFEIKYV